MVLKNIPQFLAITLAILLLTTAYNDIDASCKNFAFAGFGVRGKKIGPMKAKINTSSLGDKAPIMSAYNSSPRNEFDSSSHPEYLDRSLSEKIEKRISLRLARPMNTDLVLTPAKSVRPQIPEPDKHVDKEPSIITRSHMDPYGEPNDSERSLTERIEQRILIRMAQPLDAIKMEPEVAASTSRPQISEQEKATFENFIMKRIFQWMARTVEAALIKRILLRMAPSVGADALVLGVVDRLNPRIFGQDEAALSRSPRLLSKALKHSRSAKATTEVLNFQVYVGPAFLTTGLKNQVPAAVGI